MNPLHYPSLELCKKLTEAGFPKTELFYSEWKHTQIQKEYKWIITDTINPWDYETYKDINVCPSVMELLDELPRSKNLEIEFRWIEVIVKYTDDRYLKHSFRWNLLPNALAEMWLWLKENDLLPKK